MKKKTLKKIIATLCATAMSIPMAAASVGAIDDHTKNNALQNDAWQSDALQNDANHHQKNILNIRIQTAKSLISIFLNRLTDQMKITSEYTLKDSSLLKPITETSDSLDNTHGLLNELDNMVSNLDELNIDICNEGLKNFNAYMRDHTTMGNAINKNKLEEIESQSNNLREDLLNLLDNGADE